MLIWGFTLSGKRVHRGFTKRGFTKRGVHRGFTKRGPCGPPGYGPDGANNKPAIHHKRLELYETTSIRPMFISGCCRPIINTTVSLISLKKINGEFKIIMHLNSSMSTGQPVSTSTLAITALVSLPNLIISYNGHKN